MKKLTFIIAIIALTSCQKCVQCKETTIELNQNFEIVSEETQKFNACTRKEVKFVNDDKQDVIIHSQGRTIINRKCNE